MVTKVIDQSEIEVSFQRYAKLVPRSCLVDVTRTQDLRNAFLGVQGVATSLRVHSAEIDENAVAEYTFGCVRVTQKFGRLTPIKPEPTSFIL